MGVILRRDPDGQWVQVDTGTSATLRGVWGNGEDVWAVGTARILHLDPLDATWSVVVDWDFGDLTDIWGSPDGPVAVGEDGMWVFDGHQWTREGDVEWLTAVWGDGTHVWAVGRNGRIHRRDPGGTWLEERNGPDGLTLDGVVDPITGDLLLTGYHTLEGGAVLRRAASGSWHIERDGYGYSRFTIEQESLWTVGQQAIGFRDPKGQWLDPGPLTQAVWTDAGVLEDALIVVGQYGQAVAHHGAKDGWTQEQTGTTALLTGVVVQGQTTWVSAYGEILRRESDGTWYSELSTDDHFDSIEAHGGDLFVAGWSGRVLRHTNQGDWVPEATPTDRIIRRLWSDGDALWALGETGTLLRRDQNGVWSSMLSLGENDLRAIVEDGARWWLIGAGGGLWFMDDARLCF